MFVIYLLLIFLIVPLVLVIGSVVLPLAARFWFIFLGFPLVLILFALLKHFRTPVTTEQERGGAA
jgi:uncharacterized membrane protein